MNLDVGSRVKITTSNGIFTGIVLTYQGTEYRCSVDGSGDTAVFQKSQLELIKDSGLPEGQEGQYVSYNEEGEGIAVSPDTEPVAGSDNLITSGAVYSALAAFPSGIFWVGSVNYYSDLPNDAEVGEAYTVLYTGSSGTEPDGTEYAWGEDQQSGQGEWVAIGPDLTRLITLINSKQDTLTFDSTPTEDSNNPVTSDGIYDALATKQDTLTFDNAPTDGSTNPVTSGGVYSAIDDVNTAVATKEDIPIAHELKLTSVDWSSTEQTVEVSGVLADEKKQLIVITPKETSRTAFETAGIRAISQAADSLTFKYDTAPSGDIDVFATVIGVKKAPLPPYVTFSSPEQFSMYMAFKGWDGTLEYSTDKTTWQTYNTGTIYSSNDGKLYLRGIGNSKIYYSGHRPNWYGSNISVSGNIENLLDYTVVAHGGHPIMAANAFREFFYNGTAITDVSELVLGSPVLESAAYTQMFSYSSIKLPPKMLATTLATSCYNAMFTYCSELIGVPELPALTLESGCYNYMFDGCSKIKLSGTQTGEYTQPYRIPSNGTGTPTGFQCTDMFRGTGGTHAYGAGINYTYYLSNTNVIVPATL